MKSKGQTINTGLMGAILLVSFVTFCFSLYAKNVKQKEVDRQQAYLAGAEGFRVMHHDADIPLFPKNLIWTDKADDTVELEADGAQMVGQTRTPRRFHVLLKHEGENWTVTKSDWKN